jgi:hypothetical protein
LRRIWGCRGIEVVAGRVEISRGCEVVYQIESVEWLAKIMEGLRQES